MHANNIKIRETGRQLTQDDRTQKGGRNDLKQEFYEIQYSRTSTNEFKRRVKESIHIRKNSPAMAFTSSGKDVTKMADSHRNRQLYNTELQCFFCLYLRTRKNVDSVVCA